MLSLVMAAFVMEFLNDSLVSGSDLDLDLRALHFYNDSLLFQNNFSGGYNETDAFLPAGVKITIVAVYMMVCVVGLVGNCLVMYVIIR